MSIISFISSTVEGFLQLVYPPLCVVCQHTIQEMNDLKTICTSCLQKIQPVPLHFAREQILDRLNPCYLDGLEAVFQFDPVVQTIIHQIKYQKAERLAQKFAAYAVQFVNRSFLHRKAFVLPVPLFSSREKERGFNQSQRIAEGFFQQTKNHVYSHLLKRIRSTTTQTELNREERLKNVSKAFEVSEIDFIRGQSIIIVDDVVTTGATLNECARELKNAGALKVYGLTLATPIQLEQGGLSQPA